MGEGDRTEALEALLAPFTPDRPGLALLVTRGGRPVFERYLGAADLEHGSPVTARTPFHVASVSKQFTALAALLEARGGRLDLAGDIRKHLPELPDYGAVITAHDLIHHTSGLRDQWELMSLAGSPPGGVILHSAILDIAAAQRGLNFPPGSDFRYCNTGYSLLAEIVQRTSGKRFAQYLDEAVFAPLGMTSTCVYSDGVRLLPGRAISYAQAKTGEIRHLRLNYSNHGATSVQSTARDLALWAAELLHPRHFDAALIATLAAPGRLRDGAPLNYGFGLMRQTIGGRPTIGHGGADAAYRAQFLTYPDNDASVIVLSNGQADVGAIGRVLADAVLPPVPGATTGDAPPPASLDRLVGYYVGEWGRGVTLEAPDGRLTGVFGDMRAEARFHPDGAFWFFDPEERFSASPDGDLVVAQSVGGLPLRLRRAKRVRPGDAALAALAGLYRSDEIDITYRLAPDGEGGLAVSCLRFRSMRMAPADVDAFDGPMARLTLVRDGTGAVTGFTIGTGRIRALPFHRIA
ncbi:serine hydrolase domain-containing protein [Caulobacter sp. KR2-114]|uniref:serine hydrolase domain-containing protein n=1 Tax=Caulobacter sp. KR2-114 TaxID=3400912 RepID=UPI003C123A13